MHVEEDRLDGIGEVGAGEHQVLEGSSNRGPDSAETLAYVSTDVKIGLQSTMSACLRISRAN
jgi:hypothetical protein